MDDFGTSLNPSSIIESPNVVCKCGCKTFTEAFVLKKVSALVSSTGKEELYPIPVFVCTKCGEVPSEYMDKPNAKKIFGEEESKIKQ